MNMTIEVYPEDLVKRCLWDNYTYYVVGSEKKAEEILTNNEKFEISERDALVIGLLKVIETTNLIHKFNTYLTDFLSNRSINNDQKLKIRKKTLINTISKFENKFPNYWNCDKEYEESLKEMKDYIAVLFEALEKLPIDKITDQFGTHDFLLSKDVKKLLSFNY